MPHAPTPSPTPNPGSTAPDPTAPDRARPDADDPALADADREARRARGDRGQATTEYALILLAAALVGLLVVTWATAGGAAGRIGQLFDAVVDAVMSRI